MVEVALDIGRPNWLASGDSLGTIPADQGEAMCFHMQSPPVLHMGQIRAGRAGKGRSAF